MSAKLRRRVDKVALALCCPQCGYQMRMHHVPVVVQQREREEMSRMLSDATDEELLQINTIMQNIEARHRAACEQRGVAPATVPPL